MYDESGVSVLEKRYKKFSIILVELAKSIVTRILYTDYESLF